MSASAEPSGSSGLKVCPACGVKIAPGGITGDRVLFSAGPPGTRATLWTRVCQYAKRPGCINKEQGQSGGATG
ncbi:hypothetical protein [Thermoleptolyngbya sp.]